MKNFLSLLSLIVCVFLVSCGYKGEHLPAIPADTPTPLRAPTSISISTPIEALDPVSTPPLYFSPYPTKKFIFNYCVLGGHGNFDIFTDDQCHPLLILYEDGQMIVPGKVHQQRVLSESEISEFLDQLESRGLYTIETNQSHDPTDKLYDFGNQYKRIYNGLYYCVIVRDMGRERDLCAYDQQRQYLVPAMKDLLRFLDEYQLEGATPYYPDRILLHVEAGRNPYVQDLPERTIPWVDRLPPLEMAEYNTIYAEGETALEIYTLFDSKSVFRVFTQQGREYTLEIKPVLPHEELSVP